MKINFIEEELLCMSWIIEKVLDNAAESDSENLFTDESLVFAFDKDSYKNSKSALNKIFKAL